MMILRHRDASSSFFRLVLLAVSMVFLVSSGLKALDLTAFAVQVSYYGIVRLPALVRALAIGTIAVEAALGMALLLRLGLRRVTLPVTMGLLVGFTGLLTWAWAFRDMKNCGCFGKFLPMTPGEAILKNLAMIALAAMAWWGEGLRKAVPEEASAGGNLGGNGDDRSTNGRTVTARQRITALQRHWLLCVPLAAAGGMVALAVVNPWGGAAIPANPGGKFAKFSMDWDGKRLDLGKGLYVVAMLSDSCSHCAEIVGGLNRLSASPNFPPIVGLILGEEDTLRSFRATFAPKFPNRLIPVLEFFDLIGDAPPRFYVLKDGQIVKQWDETLPTEAVFRSAIPAEGDLSGVPSRVRDSTLAVAPPLR
jgi:hypothetical protein